MKTEIRQEVKDYILSEVQTSVMRLGYNVQLVLVEKKDYRGESYIAIDSSTFQTFPVLFKEIRISGVMDVSTDDGSDFVDVFVTLDCQWTTFGGGGNGTEIGRMYFRVCKDLPEKLTPERCRMYVDKERGLSI